MGNKGFDTATPVTTEMITNRSDCRFVGRYLGNWSKSLTPAEVELIHSHGLSIVSIWEGDPTGSDYFTGVQAMHDCSGALSSARQLGQRGGVIYATVDYDAAPADMTAICHYALRFYLDLPRQFDFGIYGSDLVLSSVRDFILSQHNYLIWTWLAGSTGWRKGNKGDVHYSLKQIIDGSGIDWDESDGRGGGW